MRITGAVTLPGPLAKRQYISQKIIKYSRMSNKYFIITFLT
jgi:hypothetical protein